MNSVPIALIAVLGLIVAAPTAMAQEADGVPQAKGDNVPVDLPPLILKSPPDVSVTARDAEYGYGIDRREFVVFDDGVEETQIHCTINGDTQEIVGSRGYGGGSYGSWHLGDGTHIVSCRATDDAGQVTLAPDHVVTVRAVDDLFPEHRHKMLIRSVAQIHGMGIISTDDFGKVIKYFHTAGIINFDIVSDGNRPDDETYRNAETITRDFTDKWGNARGVADIDFKYHLEHLAENGFFDRVDLGF